ncbi:hypothetical protein MJO29_005568 [Puccinia striiformis f. sp. tritici]|nr:hypothetical protein MJO29_005568 [Puccinia striiformis f. sp. tritici]
MDTGWATLNPKGCTIWIKLSKLHTFSDSWMTNIFPLVPPFPSRDAHNLEDLEGLTLLKNVITNYSKLSLRINTAFQNCSQNSGLLIGQSFQPHLVWPILACTDICFMGHSVSSCTALQSFIFQQISKSHLVDIHWLFGGGPALLLELPDVLLNLQKMLLNPQKTLLNPQKTLLNLQKTLLNLQKTLLNL